MLTLKEFLKKSAVKKEVIDRFLDAKQRNWARFDPELGYVLGNSMPKDGMDNSSSISTVSPAGMRTQHHYADQPCRMNTYGNSFTQCHQVSDGETWQEYLAAHLGEPVRNFGMGGYGVYQAYRRMIRTESSKQGADYSILYIWGDDHYRSLLRCRYALISSWFNKNHSGASFFHNNFWANIEMDLHAGQLVEKESLCPTPESLYRMCDPEFMYESLEDDLMLQMLLFHWHDDRSSELDITKILDMNKIRTLAEILHVPVKAGSLAELKESIAKLSHKYAFAATKYILAKSRGFAEANNKHLLISLFCPAAARQMIQSGKRYDQEIVDYLQHSQMKYFDMNEVHAADFKNFKTPLEDYFNRYLIGHYKPAGNHFFAFAIKDVLVDWLDPKPITYTHEQDQSIRFEGYLQYLS